MRNKKKISLICITALMLYDLPLMAQGSPPPNDSAPIDGGAFALVLAAATFGYIKLRHKINPECQTLSLPG